MCCNGNINLQSDDLIYFQALDPHLVQHLPISPIPHLLTMASLDTARPQTPPHHPIYGVHMPDDAIRNIVNTVFPHSKLHSIEQLPSGKSYNNRVYFISITQANSPQKQDFVIKVNGRFFGSNKIENEVASLRLLEAFCPNVPAPKVIAWSIDGVEITTTSPSADSPETIRRPVHQDIPLTYGGWIIMSRVPGEPISNLDLDETTMEGIARQLADVATSWRRDIPRQRYCGNSCLRLENKHQESADITLEASNGHGSTEILIRGILVDEIMPSAPAIPSLADYYRVRIVKKLEGLKSSKTFAPNHGLVPVIQEFLEKDFSHLLLDSALELTSPGDRKFTFTHYDLSPRNVLVTGQPPQITGIVDFEFSGFFSPIEEFLNDSVGNDADWDKTTYDAYLERLDQNGICTPGKSFEEKFWEQSLALEKLVENITPWWLPGGRQGDKLEEELKKAEREVKKAIEALS